MLLIILGFNASSQIENTNWFFGGKYNWQFPNNQDPNEPIAGLNFNNIVNGLPATNNNSPQLYSENHTSMSDQNGNLLFYTDGIFVWDKNHNQMPNGTNIGGNISSVKSSLIVPVPGNINQYYIFGLDGNPTGNGTGLFHSIVDMTLNNCLGDVVAATKKTALLGNTSEHMIGTYHGNGTDYWVLCAKDDPLPKLYCYQVSATGIAAPIINDLSIAPYNFTTDHDVYRIEYNTVGNKIAANYMGGWNDSRKFLADFNQNSGVVTFDQTYDNNEGTQFIAFSPNDQYLYECLTVVLANQNFVTSVFQYDLNAPNITASKIAVGTVQSSQNDARLGPDGKIYFCPQGTQDLNVIHNPNLAGTACNMVQNDLNLGGRWTSSLPNSFLKPIINPQIQAIDFTYQDTCLGSNTLFTYISALNYDSLRWEYGDGQINITTTNTTQHQYNTVGLYNVVLTLFDGCNIEIDTLKGINIVNGSVVDLGPDTDLCTGPATLDAGNAGATYLWSTGEVTQTINVNAIGAYWVEVTSGMCVSTDTINVTGSVVVNLGPDTNICIGQSVTLDAGNAGATYLWSTGATTQTIVVNTTANYSVQVNLNGCQNTDGIQVNVNPLPIVVANASDANLCIGEQVILTGSGANTYAWDNGVTDGIALAPDVTTIFTVTGTDLNGCEGNDNITVSVATQPSVSANSTNTSICFGDQITLTGSGANTYVWDNGVIDGVALTPTVSTTYTVVGTDVSGCINTSQITVELVNPITLQLIGDTTICLDTPLTLDPGTFTNAIYTWQDGSSASTYLVNESGSYSVSIKVGACPEVQSSVKISIKDCSCVLYLPNSFTPDGDNLNDDFGTLYTCDLESYTLSVFNRWGDLVFETSDPEINWDGTFANKQLPIGVYVYKLEYKSKNDGSVKNLTGKVTLIK